jgi:hypothetical protein
MKKLTLTIIAFLGLFVGAMAQTATHGVDITINSVAMIRAVNGMGGTALNSGFIVGPLTNAGAMPRTNEANDNVLYLQYTSIKTATGTPRTIKAVLSGTIPTGLSIYATAATPTGTGDVGLTLGSQAISTIAATLINNIGSGYTGTATNNGANIFYSSTITTMASLKATTSTPLTVTYTLSSE